jgi:hypothetical protein
MLASLATEDIDMMMKLVQCPGLLINSVCEEGSTALMYACRRAIVNSTFSYKIVQILLQHPGIRVSIQNKVSY